VQCKRHFCSTFGTLSSFSLSPLNEIVPGLKIKVNVVHVGNILDLLFVSYQADPMLLTNP
jgi:hypothetical protein